MRDYRLGACCAAIVWLFALSAGATEPLNEHLPSPFPTPSIPKQKIIVGITPGPPFNIHQSDGTWTGISVDLWREIASDLGLNFEFRETDLPGNFDGLASGWLDVAVGPLAIMALVAALIWLGERRANAAAFGGHGRATRGFGAALWWSAVTMTTVGYGDISPQTFKGRVIAVVWMFVSLVLVSTFTATMASIMTAARLDEGSAIRGLEDLQKLRVGTFSASTAAQYLEENHIDYATYPRAALFNALKTNKIQAIVYDEPFLRYMVRNEYPTEFTVIPLRLDPQLYAFAVREGSSLRESINRELLRKIHEPAWRDLLYHYMGAFRQ